MAEEVPCYFLCPISLQMMRDPVTLPTGITYDRDGIERWILTAGTCPLTKQAVPADCEPTPNHTLRRLIQAWCTLHHHAGDDEVISPPTKPPPNTDRARVASLLSRIADGARRRPRDHDEALRELRDVAAESERNRKLVAAVPGAVETLMAVFVSSSSSDSRDGKAAAACMLLEIVSSLQLSEQRLVRVVETTSHEAVVDALVCALQGSNAASREHAAQVLADVTGAMAPSRLASLPEQVFREVVHLLHDKKQVSSRAATMAALQVLVGTTSWGRNRVKAVDAGAVAVLVDTLLEDAAQQRRACELALGALDRLCGCAEGRAELVAHAAGVAVVASKAAVRRASDAAADKAVRVLRSVAKHAATPAVVQEMAQTGAVAALCLVAARSADGDRTGERARETLRLHARAWRTSPCLHQHLRAMYPPC
jgi:hypothetical protein